MSEPGAVANGSPWGQSASVQTLQGNVELRSPEDHHRAALTRAYHKARAALETANKVIADIASSFYDVEASQNDVSARLTGRAATRYAGKKRKLSPSVYDYTDSCLAASRAATPTQELLPACRNELRNHQLQAVRWLASLEQQGAGGVLADELEDDRRAEVAGLLSHMLATAPHLEHVHTPLGLGHASAAPGVGGGGSAASGAQVCMLLAPGRSLSGWAEVINEHVDVCLHVYDGSASSAAALQAMCAGSAARGAHPPPHAQHHSGAQAPGLGPLSQQQQPGPVAAPAAPLSAGPRGVPPGGVHHHSHPHSLLGSASNSSAAGVFPPGRPGHAAGPAASPLIMRQPGPGASGRSLLVVLAPLEHLHRDAALLTQIPQRLLVVDLAVSGGSGGGGVAGARFSGSGASASGVHYGSGGAGSSAGSAAPAGGDSGGAEGLFGCSFGPGSEPGSGSGPGSRARQGMDLEAYHHLHLLNRMPASSRVLLSAGSPEPSGNGIWLLLQLLAPKMHHPLWEAVCELQQGLVASGPVGSQSKESVLADVHGRLWGLLRPLTLHRRARDVDLATMRAVATNLNLYDHFSAVRADGV